MTSGVWSFSWICAKFYWAQNFVEFVLGCFSYFNIEIAYLNFTFCGAWTPIFCEFTWKLSKYQQNEHTLNKCQIQHVWNEIFRNYQNSNFKSKV